MQAGSLVSRNIQILRTLKRRSTRRSLQPKFSSSHGAKTPRRTMPAQTKASSIPSIYRSLLSYLVLLAISRPTHCQFFIPELTSRPGSSPGSDSWKQDCSTAIHELCGCQCPNLMPIMTTIPLPSAQWVWTRNGNCEVGVYNPQGSPGIPYCTCSAFTSLMVAGLLSNLSLNTDRASFNIDTSFPDDLGFPQNASYPGHSTFSNQSSWIMQYYS